MRVIIRCRIGRCSTSLWESALAVCLTMLLVSTFAGDASAVTRSARLPPSNTRVENVTFVAFDLETTGLSPSTDRIVEIGAVKFRDGKIIDQKSWLINPGRSIPWLVQQVHGITDEMVRDAPSFAEIYDEFMEFIDGTVLMAHNARFDVSFLRAEIERAGLPVPKNKVIDTLRLFRKWFPNAPSGALSDLVNHTKVPAGIFHRALEDSGYLVLIFNEGLSKRPHITYLRDVYAEADGALML